MSLVTDVIDVFHGESKRILWMPSLALGYIYTLSGNRLAFALAVAAIGGALIFGDLLDRVDGSSNEPLWEIVSPITDRHHVIRIWFVAILCVLYPIAVLYGGLSVYYYFDYTDLVLVGLAGLYLSPIIALIVNIDW